MLWCVPHKVFPALPNSRSFISFSLARFSSLISLLILLLMLIASICCGVFPPGQHSMVRSRLLEGHRTGVDSTLRESLWCDGCDVYVLFVPSSLFFDSLSLFSSSLFLNIFLLSPTKLPTLTKATQVQLAIKKFLALTYLLKPVLKFTLKCRTYRNKAFSIH